MLEAVARRHREPRLGCHDDVALPWVEAVARARGSARAPLLTTDWRGQPLWQTRYESAEQTGRIRRWGTRGVRP